MMITYPTPPRRVFSGGSSFFLNLDMYMVYHLKSPCVEVPSSSSDHVEGFVVWTLPAEILDKSYSGKCQSRRKHLDVREKEAMLTEVLCIPLSPWIAT